MVGLLIAEGRTSEIFALNDDAVVKVPRPGVPPHWAEVEAALSDAVHRAGLPCPEVYGLTEVDGRESIVFERLHGPSLWDLMKTTTGRLEELVAMLVELQRSIHRAERLASVPRLTDRLRSKILVAHGLSDEERRDASTLVASLPSGSSLCHGDLHPANIIVTDRGPMAIDWFDTAVGPPISDLARTSLLVRPPGRGRVGPHLPGAEPELLAAIHRCYVEQAIASHTVDLDESGRAALADELLTWERVLAAGRLAEHTTTDRVDLLELWRQPRPGGPASALGRSLVGLGLRDQG